MKTLIGTMTAFLMATSFAYPGPADPGIYKDQVIPANDIVYYVENLVADNEMTIIELEGECNAGQDIDLHIFDVETDTPIISGDSFECYEAVEIWTYKDSPIAIFVENLSDFPVKFDLLIY